MILGATYGDIVSFLIVLGVSVPLGGLFIPLHFLRLVTKSRIFNFIYDLAYAIMVGGIFVLTMIYVNFGSIKYYHILALMIGLIVLGVLPAEWLSRFDNRFLERFESFRARLRGTRLYNIIKK